jgi:hypothetical protein
MACGHAGRPYILRHLVWIQLQRLNRWMSPPHVPTLFLRHMNWGTSWVPPTPLTVLLRWTSATAAKVSAQQKGLAG